MTLTVCETIYAANSTHFISVKYCGEDQNTQIRIMTIESGDTWNYKLTTTNKPVVGASMSATTELVIKAFKNEPNTKICFFSDLSMFSVTRIDELFEINLNIPKFSSATTGEMFEMFVKFSNFRDAENKALIATQQEKIDALQEKVNQMDLTKGATNSVV